jgi:hypothetical protein
MFSKGTSVAVRAMPWMPFAQGVCDEMWVEERNTAKCEEEYDVDGENYTVRNFILRTIHQILE